MPTSERSCRWALAVALSLLVTPAEVLSAVRLPCTEGDAATWAVKATLSRERP